MGNASRRILGLLYGEEKMMAAQNKGDKAKNEIRCQRCNGRMIFENSMEGMMSFLAGTV
jgi:DNA-directed RNA polymerase subunit RPC12/RpoP